MAEVIGIVASAIAFAQATAAVLDAMNKIKDAPKSIQELQYELRELEAVLRQIDSTSSCQKGEPTATVLRSCSDMLKRLRDLIAPFRQEAEENKFKQYVKGLRIRSIEGEIESAVKRLQSQKLTLTLALIASVHRSDSLSYPSRNDNINTITGDLINHFPPQPSLIGDMRCYRHTVKIWAESLVTLEQRVGI